MPYQTSTPNASGAIDSDYFCGRCGGFFTSLYATRPPVYNPDNCSCVEASGASHDFGGATQLLQTEQSLYHYGNTAILFENPPAPVSCASSNQSRDARGPEGPERDLPNTQLSGGFSAVVPGPGLGEDRHRRTSFRSEMSWLMQRYIHEQQDAFEREQREERQHPATSYNTSRGQVQSGNRFPNEAVVLRSASGSGSGKTKSWESEGSGGSGESALAAWETAPVDPVRGIGAWAGEGTGLGIGGVGMERRGYAGFGYPLDMSGMTEALYEVERERR